MNKIIELTDISVNFDGSLILNNINFSIYEKDYIGIIGPNGGGKTTLLKIILGILQPQQGKIKYYLNEDNSPISIGYLPQELNVDMNFPINVEEVILSGLTKKNKISWNKENKQKVAECLSILGLEEMKNRPIKKLSGGQLQRTIIGRAIISDPNLLVLDEPNTYMDERSETELYNILQKLNERMSIIMVSHNINTISSHAKSIIKINQELSWQ